MGKIKDYILDAGGFNDETQWKETGVSALREQVDFMVDGVRIKTPEQAGREMARGGCFAVCEQDAEKDLREVWGIVGGWGEYVEQVGRAVGVLYRGEFYHPKERGEK